MPHAHPCVLCLPCGVSKSYTPNPKRLLYRPPLKNLPLTPARAPPRRVQCVCQNEVEKIRRTYCLNPKSFGLPINFYRLTHLFSLMLNRHGKCASSPAEPSPIRSEVWMFLGSIDGASSIQILFP